MTIVQINLSAPDGRPLAGARVTAALNGPGISWPRVVLQEEVTVIADQYGNASMALFPNTGAGEVYTITIRHRAILNQVLRVTVPDVTTITLAELLGGRPVMTTPLGAIVNARGHIVSIRGPLISV
jgi:hypothetical protein